MNFVKNFAKQKTILLLIAILAIAAFFRFYQLADIPPGLYPDVAINGNDALKALETGEFKIFYPENNGREGLFINLIAFSFWLFGASVWAIKIVPAIIGLLAVLGIYFLTKELFFHLGAKHGETIALLSAFFLSISFWHVNFSRLGFRAIMAPFFLTWSFYFLFKALRQRGQSPNSPATIAYWLLAGAFFGLGFHTYIAFRAAPLILIPLLVIGAIQFWQSLKKYCDKLSLKKALFQSYIKDGWHGWDLFILMIILAALPIVIYFWQNSADFIGRSGQVSVFSSAKPLKTLLESGIKTLGQFLIRGDNNWRHNIAGSPQILWPLIPFFLLGIGFSIRQILRSKNYLKKDRPELQTHYTLLVWWAVMLLPSIMTVEGLPHALRSIGSIIPTYIFSALGVFLIINYIGSLIKTKNALIVFYGLLVATVLLFIAVQYYSYFIFWGGNQATREAFTQRFVDQAVYLRSLPAETQKYVLVNEPGVPAPYPDGLPMPAQTIIFFNRETPNIRYFIEDPASPMTPDKLISAKDPTVILPMKPDANLFKKLNEIFPSGQQEQINGFEVFKINF